MIPFCELFSLPLDHPRFEVAFSTVKPEMFTLIVTDCRGIVASGVSSTVLRAEG